jgi:alpha-glucosidase
LDFSIPDVRNWYANQLIPLLKAGIDGWWNDEGEQTYTTYTYWNQAEAQALSQVDPKRRLWTINRAFQPGMQREGYLQGDEVTVFNPNGVATRNGSLERAGKIAFGK